MYVVVPLAVYWLAKALALPGPVRLAIFVLAISAGAPLLPRKLANLGREGYVFSLVVTSSLLAVVTVPAWMELLGWVLGRESSLDSWAVARLIAKAFLAPLAAGMVLRRLLPKIAEKLSGRIFGAAGAVLAIAALTLLVLGRRLLFEVGWVALLALAGTAVVALAIGHVMGGPDPRDRKALAVSCVTRHVGIAMLAASTAQGTQTTALVLVYLVAAAIVTVPYVKWGQGTKGGATAS
jgi:BASS family bile acid:Na+ symporter